MDIIICDSVIFGGKVLKMDISVYNEKVLLLFFVILFIIKYVLDFFFINISLYYCLYDLL